MTPWGEISRKWILERKGWVTQTLTDVLWIITLLTRKTKPSKPSEVTELSYLINVNGFIAKILENFSSLRNLLKDVKQNDGWWWRLKIHLSAIGILQEKLQGFALLKSNNNSRNRRYFKFTAGGKHFRLHLRNPKQVPRKLTFWRNQPEWIKNRAISL